MQRQGHSRPVGTTWRMRLHSWKDEREPELGDLVAEEPEGLKRGFVVVGVEETRDRSRWWITLERLDWADFLTRLAETNTPVWSFVRDRR